MIFMMASNLMTAAMMILSKIKNEDVRLVSPIYPVSCNGGGYSKVVYSYYVTSTLSMAVSNLCAQMRNFISLHTDVK